MHDERYQDLTEAPIHWSVRFGNNVRVGYYVVIEQDCKIGNNVIICHGVKIRQNVVIGNNSIVGHNCVIETDTIIGKKVTFQSQCHITKFTTIADHCFFGPKAMCINTYHISHGREFEAKLTGPTFGLGCRVGAGAIIMPGVKLGQECEIGAGAVVTKNCEAFKTYMGIPAKYVRPVPENEKLNIK